MDADTLFPGCRGMIENANIFSCFQNRISAVQYEVPRQTFSLNSSSRSSDAGINLNLVNDFLCSMDGKQGAILWKQNWTFHVNEYKLNTSVPISMVMGSLEMQRGYMCLIVGQYEFTGHGNILVKCCLVGMFWELVQYPGCRCPSS